MKADILPLGIIGCEEYNWNPLKRKHIKVMLGEPISYNQELDEIFDEWGTKVSQLTEYEYVKEEETQEEKQEVTTATSN